jgi:hypothetical protein
MLNLKLAGILIFHEANNMLRAAFIEELHIKLWRTSALPFTFIVIFNKSSFLGLAMVLLAGL